MGSTKNVFISHVHADDELVPKLKELVLRQGMTIRDGSITADKPNGANNEDYIWQQYLRPHLDWASTIVVLITHETAKSPWVDREIKYAAEHGKTVVGVFAQGATDAELPEALQKCGEAAIVGWNGPRIVDAINGVIRGSDEPTVDASPS